MSLFPKVLWSFTSLTLTLNKPSLFFECYLLFDHFCLTMIDELYVYMFVYVCMCMCVCVYTHALYSYAN